MGGIRRQFTIIGPGASGFVRASYRLTPDEPITIDIPSDTLPPGPRMPNATFVGVIDGHELMRVETDGEAWLTIQDRIREVLNRHWDPIGVADVVADEYDGYIGDIYRLLRSGASDVVIAAHLRAIETDRMELQASPLAKLHSVAAELGRLDLPRVSAV